MYWTHGYTVTDIHIMFNTYVTYVYRLNINEDGSLAPSTILYYLLHSKLPFFGTWAYIDIYTKADLFSRPLHLPNVGRWSRRTRIAGRKVYIEMVGGFKYFLFSPRNLVGEIIKFDEHIFQMGWFNHQLERRCLPKNLREIGRPRIWWDVPVCQK